MIGASSGEFIFHKFTPKKSNPKSYSRIRTCNTDYINGERRVYDELQY